MIGFEKAGILAIGALMVFTAAVTLVGAWAEASSPFPAATIGEAALAPVPEALALPGDLICMTASGDCRFAEDFGMRDTG